MSNFRITLLYGDDVSNLTWSVTAVNPAPGYTDALDQADLFNTAYLNVCADSVKLLDCFLEILDVPNGYFHTSPSTFSNQQGSVALPASEIASYAMYRGWGYVGSGGSAFWKLHGIAQTFVNGSVLDTTAPDIGLLLIACGDYLLQYRPTATPLPPAGRGLPVVDPPITWARDELTGMYNKRLGRPRWSPGQQHRYPRVVAV